MTLLGFVGIMDPPRPEARAAEETSQHAGVKPVMITGDHPATAKTVARELGLLASGRVVSGQDLEAMPTQNWSTRFATSASTRACLLPTSCE